MQNITFEQLPNAVGTLLEKVSNLEQWICSSQQQNNGTEKPLTLAEAALHLDLTVATLYTMAQKKAIPYHKPGKKLYFFKEELNQWIREGMENPLLIEAEQDMIYANRRKTGGIRRMG